jgi:ribosome-associated protein
MPAGRSLEQEVPILSTRSTRAQKAEGTPVARSARAAKPAVAEKAAPPVTPPHFAMLEALTRVIDDAKAEDIVTLDLAGKTSLADAMIVASGRSDRHVGAIAERVASSLREMGQPPPRMEGMTACDWVLIDTGDLIIHLFRPEVRGFYNLEKLWGAGRPSETPGTPPTPASPGKTPKPKRVTIRTTDDDAAPRRPRRKAAEA